MEKLIEAFELLLGNSEYAGECFEVAPQIGVKIRPATEFINNESKISADMTYDRSHHLHEVMKD